MTEQLVLAKYTPVSRLLCAYRPPEEENGLLFWEKTPYFPSQAPLEWSHKVLAAQHLQALGLRAVSQAQLLLPSPCWTPKNPSESSTEPPPGFVIQTHLWWLNGEDHPSAAEATTYHRVFRDFPVRAWPWAPMVCRTTHQNWNTGWAI